MNWIPFVIWILLGVSLGVWAIWIAISAERCDKEHYEWIRNHPNLRITRSFHTDVMAGYWTAVIVIGGFALAILGITVMSWVMK